MEKFVSQVFPQLFSLYKEKLPFKIQKIDLWRYLVLLWFGGYYADLDCECLQPLSQLIPKIQQLYQTKQEPTIILGKSVFQTVEISFMGSVPGHPLWIQVIQQVYRNILSSCQSLTHCQSDLIFHFYKRWLPQIYVLKTTGPACMGQVLHSFYPELTEEKPDLNKGIFLLPRMWFFPKDFYHRSVTVRDPRNQFVIHHCDGSWYDKGDILFCSIMFFLVFLVPAVVMVLGGFTMGYLTSHQWWENSHK